MRVLLVEDSRPIRQENERALARAGYDVLCAEDGERALIMARREQPELILLDLLLPRMGGVQVLRELKKDPTTMDIPVVIVSVLSARNQEKLLAEGAEAYLEKSVILADHRQNRLPALLQEILGQIHQKKGKAGWPSPRPNR